MGVGPLIDFLRIINNKKLEFLRNTVRHGLFFGLLIFCEEDPMVIFRYGTPTFQTDLVRIVPHLSVHVDGQYLETYKVHFDKIKRSLGFPKKGVRKGHLVMKFRIYVSTIFHDTIG